MIAAMTGGSTDMPAARGCKSVATPPACCSCHHQTIVGKQMHGVALSMLLPCCAVRDDTLCMSVILTPATSMQYLRWFALNKTSA